MDRIIFISFIVPDSLAFSLSNFRFSNNAKRKEERNMKKWTFDNFFYKIMIFFKLGFIANYYKKTEWFQRLIKFGFSGTVIYWFIRAPITFIVTEYMNIHYLVSTFLVGLILTFIWFALSDLWVWKERR